MNDKTFTSIKLYLSPAEKIKIETISHARGISLSEYCKNRILQSGINITIKTEDLSNFAQQISGINDSINSFLSILKQNELNSPSDTEYIEQLLTELNSNCRELLKDRYKKRKNIETELKDYIHNYLEKK